jgi:septum formation protein
MKTPSLPIILASQSQARKRMLKAAGIIFRAIKPEIDESSLKRAISHINAKGVAEQLAEAKAKSLGKRFPNCIIIGSDQTLELGGDMISKPRSRGDALKQLQAMRGKTHVLHSGVACVYNEKLVWNTVESARLTMRRFSDQFLESYLDKINTDVTSSVGGYKIEGAGLQLFDKIQGDHSVILGMPLLSLLKFLRRQGVILA